MMLLENPIKYLSVPSHLGRISLHVLYFLYIYFLYIVFMS